MLSSLFVLNQEDFAVASHTNHLDEVEVFLSGGVHHLLCHLLRASVISLQFALAFFKPHISCRI